jgi:hypothetical protein
MEKTNTGILKLVPNHGEGLSLSLSRSLYLSPPLHARARQYAGNLTWALLILTSSVLKSGALLQLPNNALY